MQNFKENNIVIMAIAQERVAEIYTEFGGSAKNTGSIEGQVAVLTERINHISAHLKENHKDHSSRLSLIKMVGRRKKFLKYIAKKDVLNYRALIKKLNIRK